MSTSDPAEGRTFHLTITQVTSFLIVTQRKTRQFTGTYAQLQERYRKVLVHNLLFGWWGIPFGLIGTPLALSRNAKALKQLRQLAESPPSAASDE